MTPSHSSSRGLVLVDRHHCHAARRFFTRRQPTSSQLDLVWMPCVPGYHRPTAPPCVRPVWQLYCLIFFFSGTKGHVWSRAPRRTQPDRCSTPTFLMAVTAYRYLGVRSRQAILPGTRLYWKIINRVIFMEISTMPITIREIEFVLYI
jgi:hypothetical protein